MKTIALFGGTGFVGDQITNKLIESHYRIRMLVRDPAQARAMQLDGALTAVHGSIDNIKAVSETLKGCDACIVATGARSNSLEDMQAIVTGTQNIINAMQAQNIKRLVKLSGVSVRVGDEPFSLPRRLLDLGLKLAMPNPSKSKYLEQEIIENSQLDWIVVRPPVVSADKINKTFTAHQHNYLGLKVSLDDLSQFMVDQLEDNTWLRQCPTLGYL